MNTNTLQPEYAEIAEAFLLAWDNGDYDSIPAEIFILELVEKCQAAALKRNAGIADAERWRKWLPYLRQLNKKPFDLAKEIKAIDAAMQSGKPPEPNHEAEALEAKAKKIYDSWSQLLGWVPWVEGGNSNMQNKARHEAISGK